MDNLDRAALIQALEAMKEELQALRMTQAAQQGAYLVLARRLAAEGLLNLTGLAGDLTTLGETLPDETGFPDHLTELAGALLQFEERSSLR